MKLKYDEPVSNFAFKFNLRRYTKIVRLWRQLRVPLLHRSQFLLAFRGRETFYYEAGPRGHSFRDPTQDA